MKNLLIVLGILAFFQTFAQPQLEVESFTGDKTSFHGNSMIFSSPDNYRSFNWFANTSDADPKLTLNFNEFDGFDVVFVNNLLNIDGDDGRIGVGKFDPEAVFHIEKGDVPQLMVGDAGGNLAYFTVNQPTEAGSATDGIARFRDDGSTKFRINESAHTYQVQLFGDAQISGGVWSASDRNLKNDIEPLTSTLSKIARLQPRSYYYKHQDAPTKHLDLPEEFQFGLVAQELQEVFPNLVKTSIEYGEAGEELGEYSMVNYTGLIPVLLAGVQEQQQIIEEQATEMAQLKSDLEKIEHLDVLLSKAEYLEERLAQLEALETKMTAMENTIQNQASNGSNTSVLEVSPKAFLEQNAPNPFQGETNIRYFIPNEVQNAALQIRDMNGRLLKSFSITEKGAGSVLLKANELPNGQYTYSLLSGGKVMDSKQMVMVR